MTPAPDGAPPALSADEARALAQQHGLERLGGRPPFGVYVRRLWQRRSFLWTLSRAQASSKNADDRLGVLWHLLNPLFLVVSYFLIFGLLLETRRGVDNFIAFLPIGVVVFGFSSSAITTGSKAIINNLNLVRALRFPRAMLPLGVVISEALATLPAYGVLVIVMLATGELPKVSWLLVPAAFLIQCVILSGLVLMGARLLNAARDVGNLIPVSIRLLRYVSGVFFSIEHYAGNHEVVATILNLQPFALPITMTRQAFLDEMHIDWAYWGIGCGWAVLLFSAGLWLFWRDEANYGRA